MKIKDGLNDVFMLLMLAILFASFLGCKSVKQSTETSYSKTDSSWVTPTLVQVPVKGGATPALNMDSIRQAFRLMTEKPGYIYTSSKDTSYIRDTSGRAELKYWIDAAGNLYASCEAKDQFVATLINQNNRLIKENKQVVKEKVETKSNWVQLLMGNGAMIAFILFLVFRELWKAAIPNLWSKLTGRDKAA